MVAPTALSEIWFDECIGVGISGESFSGLLVEIGGEAIDRVKVQLADAMQRSDLRNPAAEFRPRAVIAKLVLIVIIEAPLMTGIAQSLKDRSVAKPESMNQFPGDLVQEVRAISPSCRGNNWKRR